MEATEELTSKQIVMGVSVPFLVLGALYIAIYLAGRAILLFDHQLFGNR